MAPPSDLTVDSPDLSNDDIVVAFGEWLRDTIPRDQVMSTIRTIRTIAMSVPVEVIHVTEDGESVVERETVEEVDGVTDGP